MPHGIRNELGTKKPRDIHLLGRHTPTSTYDVTARQAGRRQI